MPGALCREEEPHGVPSGGKPMDPGEDHGGRYKTRRGSGRWKAHGVKCTSGCDPRLCKGRQVGRGVWKISFSNTKRLARFLSAEGGTGLFLYYCWLHKDSIWQTDYEKWRNYGINRDERGWDAGVFSD